MLAAALAGLYLVVDPSSGDLAAQVFRADLFDDHGFTLWTNAWYGGIHVPGYSLLYPPLGALLGATVLGALAAVASAALFAAMATRAYGPQARLGALWFALATATNLAAGRITFALGVAFALAALLALQRRRPWPAVALAALTACASPVAALFLALAGAALALASRPRGVGRARADRYGAPSWYRGAAVAAAALAVTGALALAFPVAGTQPFVASAFVAIPVVVVVALILLPRGERVLRFGFGLYGLAAVCLFVIETPVGGNLTRLGTLFAGPVLALALAGRRRVALALVAVPLLAWQWSAPVRHLEDAWGDPSIERAFYQPLVDELDSLTGGAPVRVHVPPTQNRWEAVYVARSYPLARGWLRQAESGDFELFEHGHLTPAAHLAWLSGHGVSYLALPLGVKLDYIASDEAELVSAGQPYLRPVWRNPDWRLYEVSPPPALVSAPRAALVAARDARLAVLGPDSFELTADRAASYLVKVHWSPYWRVTGGEGCVERSGDWTQVEATAPSLITVEAGFDLGTTLGGGERCSE